MAGTRAVRGAAREDRSAYGTLHAVVSSGRLLVRLAARLTHLAAWFPLRQGGVEGQRVRAASSTGADDDHGSRRAGTIEHGTLHAVVSSGRLLVWLAARLTHLAAWFLLRHGGVESQRVRTVSSTGADDDHGSRRAGTIERPRPTPPPGSPRPVPPSPSMTTAQPMAWGWVACLALVGAVGVLAMTGGNALSRAGLAGAEPVFWVGFLLIVIPAGARLASRAPTRLERASLVTLIGFLLYVTKVLHDPFAFTYGDELIHLRNAEDILRAGALFPQNSILPVTTFYPGLETVTAGLSWLTGLSSFGAGVIVIGAARITMMLALFLFFERIGGSARLAGIAALIYVANPNFLFWSGQFSYQSLALPLAVLAVLGAVERPRSQDEHRRLAWMIVALVCIAAVVMTHHLTAYALLLFLIVLSLTASLGIGRRVDSAWLLVVFAAQAIVLWAVQVAPLTDSYLTSIFDRTFEGLFDTVGGGSETRQLFTSSDGNAAEVWERVVGLSSVVLIALALPFGLWRMRRRRRRAAAIVVLALCAAAYLAALPLRLVPSAWETANRASDFLFIGIAIAVAFAGVHMLRPFGRRAAGLAVFCGFLAVVTMGGAIAGWPPTVRLSQPYRAVIGDHVAEPQGAALARWSLAALGPDHRWVADETNGRLLLAYGLQLPRSPRDGLARTILEPEKLESSVVDAIRSGQVSFVAVDRRTVANDSLAGYFFAPSGRPREGRGGFVDPRPGGKFDVPSTDRLFDSGDIAAYDIRRISP